MSFCAGAGARVQIGLSQYSLLIGELEGSYNVLNTERFRGFND
jgi:hypothetical protein